jgi:hypothetical protein
VFVIPGIGAADWRLTAFLTLVYARAARGRAGVELLLMKFRLYLHFVALYFGSLRERSCATCKKHLNKIWLAR